MSDSLQVVHRSENHQAVFFGLFFEIRVYCLIHRWLHIICFSSVFFLISKTWCREFDEIVVMTWDMIKCKNIDVVIELEIKLGWFLFSLFFYDFCRMILGIKATLGASAVVDFKAVSDVKDKSRLVLQAMFLLEL